MNRVERLPTARIETALHEAGHALACLIIDCQVYYWMILDPELPVRMHRRIRRKARDIDGAGVVAHAKTRHELLVSLSGEASEYASGRMNAFIADEMRTLDDVRDFYGEGSDQYNAWVTATEAHVNRNMDVTGPEIRRKIMNVYGQVRTLFQTPPFRNASGSLSQYMLERGSEEDNVDARMRQYLHMNGFSKSMLAVMKNKLLKIRLPVFEKEPDLG